jgi:chromosome partitioning protein
VSKVISFVNQKGGVSKSTTSIHFTYWLMKQGKRVLLVDADAQQSSSQWVKGIEAVEVVCEVLSTPDELLEKIPVLAEQCDYLVVDGPASLSEATRAILFRTDLAIIPVQPSGVNPKRLCF